MATSDLYCSSTRVWLPDAAAAWRSAELLRDYTPGDSTLAVRLDDGTVVDYALDPRSSDLPPLRNPDLLVGADDLTALSYLHEPALLHSLKMRFMDSRLIYTYCGNVLVAINPFEDLPIYGADSVAAYSGQNMGDVAPHIFAVAEEAYRQMARAQRNQCIVVSGESGAGKTVSAKYAMRYFATVSCSSDRSSYEDRVLASGPVLEALGNAKTSRNDNSSRFGKFIEISFDRRLCVSGANIRTYLLEKSRVVFQAHGERNYHIFYQLCSSSHLPEFKDFQLGCADNFHCTKQGRCPVIDVVDDAKEMCNTRRALSRLGISERDQMAIFQVLAALLHLSNVEVKDLSADRSRISPENTHLMVFCDLLGVSPGGMAHWLCHRKLKTKTETYVRCVSRMTAVSGRDALAKHIYTRLFTHIVNTINSVLQSAEKRCCIGVLDIYGFETFDFNSFEQFCINYANEKLQQQFNQLVFKLEQEEYKKEEIPWMLIDFYDNKPCIDLIEAKLGVLDLLDDECKLLSGSDDSWAQKMYNTLLKDGAHFNKPKLSNRAFIINHFAGRVEYQCEGFVEKNKDTINEEQVAVLKNSNFDLLLKLFEQDVKAPNTTTLRPSSPPPGPGPAPRRHKRTVGLQFRDSLHSLMDTLDATTPHYVRCIKSNDHKAPFTLDPVRAVQQLRACGILETIQISAAGFPSRWTYQDFFSRYEVLMRKKEVLLDRKQTCKNLLGNLIKDQGEYQLGKNKIFFRAGQVAYLERLRSEKLRMASVLIQKTIRCWLARQSYLRMRKSAVTIQRHARGRWARGFVTFLRRSRAAVVIQQNVRMWTARKRYHQQRSAAVAVQRFFRAYKARKLRCELMFEQTAVLIQKWVRGWLARRHLKHTLAAIVLLQRCVRRMKAKRELKRLKVEARSVEHFKKLNVVMEHKIMQLQHAINQQQKENGELSEKLKAVETQSMKTERDNEEIHGPHRSEQEAEAPPSLPEQLSLLQQELENIRKDKQELEKQLATYKEQTKRVLEELHVRNRLLNGEKDELNKLILQQAQQLAEVQVRVDQMEEDLSERRSASLTCSAQPEQLHASDEEMRQQEVPPLRALMDCRDAPKREDAEVKLDLKMSSRQHVDASTDILSCDEDEELWRVYESLKDTIRRLQRQVQLQDHFHHECITHQLQEVNQLRDVNERLLSHASSDTNTELKISDV